MQDDAFGGVSSNTPSLNKSAYILFYQRDQFYNENNTRITDLREGFKTGMLLNFINIKQDLMKIEYNDFVASFLGNSDFKDFISK